MPPKINTAYLLDFLFRLLNTPSPTGNTEPAIALVEAEFAKLQLKTARTTKGALVASFLGKATDAPRALSGHVDTLGAMVKAIKPNGRLVLTKIGGYYSGSIIGEYCSVETESGTIYTGTVLLSKQSVHIHSIADIHKSAGSFSEVEIRLDVLTTSKAETEALGIQVGDFVSWDTRTQLTEAGFIKSRHLDDKASVALFLAVAEAFQRENIIPAQQTYFYISPYEEVGHGAASGIPDSVKDLLVVDIGIVGEGQASDEHGVSICVKDGGGPYDVQLRRHLTRLAKEANIRHNLDVFVNYSSDGTAAWRAGAECRVGLIGPGVDASHTNERTHQDALMNTANLISSFLQAP